MGSVPLKIYNMKSQTVAFRLNHGKAQPGRGTCCSISHSGVPQALSRCSLRAVDELMVRLNEDNYLIDFVTLRNNALEQLP